VETGHRLLGNRYELVAVLASGGMGRVWRARDVLLNRPVAVKILRSEFTGDPSFVSRFRAEAQHAALLQHPNIAAVFDYGELEEQGEHLAYLVMELVEGESLASLLARERTLDVPRTLSIMRQTSAALGAAHAAGVVHRDVKPGNVLVAPDGVVKIADFGIAWSASSVPLTRTGQVIGTAHYLSPEQASGGKATPASDVYALGAVAYECLAGRRAFEGENSVQIAVKQIREEPDPLPADLPAPVRGLVERAMTKDPAQRFPDGAALQRAVEDVLAAEPRSSGTVPMGVSSGQTGTAVMPLSLATRAGAAGAVRSAGSRVPLSGRPAVVRMLLGALAVVAAIALAVVLLGNDPAPKAEEPATTETTAPAISVVAADLVGRPVAEVQAVLVAKGLTVTVTPSERADVPAGQVTAVAPVGDLAPNATVTVTYAVPPVVVPTTPPSPVGTGDGNRNGNGDGDDDEEEDGDKGNGRNGNGNGNGKKDD
jgi:hypothetical protein